MTSPAPGRIAEGRRFSFRTTDADEACEAIAATYYANFIDVLGEGPMLDASFEVVRLGALTLGDLRCGAPVAIRFGDLGAHHVDLPLTGRIAWGQRGGDARLATAARAAVFDPVGDTRLDHWAGDCRVIAVKIEPSALRDHLERLLGRPVRCAPRLDPEFDSSAGPGLTWARTARLVIGEMDNPGGLLDQPMLAARFEETLLSGLLLAAGHPYREELAAQPSTPVSLRPVRLVLDAIHARPEHPFTTTGLASTAGVGTRWLQAAFRRHLGVSPMAYLREVRLDRAHHELTTADPSFTTVAEVAYRWGFGHLGRFAEKYRGRFGELPSETLNSGRG
ncbi:AraC family transcriptional regulator [Streptomyces roseirectus]|uniref:AraC family transcriptional regulator n=1 Tax=Streptomyces roseirectus TaxID=2768066 RepID=A0A7H0I858_9ACTN|nr:AraC family transcriptional regulator [Streptomyces roseirectus]QNP68974.1 AraC family transcriptional regulator [Streptomyces roseirectus]